MLYSRYVVNDRHYGTISAAPGPAPNAFYDQGHFGAVQQRNKAIALYALQAQHEEVSSLKTVVALRLARPAAGLDEVWLGERASAPRTCRWTSRRASGWWWQTAPSTCGVRPLQPGCLGREAPIVLEQGPEGELWLTIYNYRVASASGITPPAGRFWQGNLRAGYILEVAERGAYPSAAAFLDLRSASRAGRDGAGPRVALVRSVTYGSGGDELRLRYDLWHTRPLDRRLNGLPYHPPALRSPVAAQGSSGAAGRERHAAHRPQPRWLLAQELDRASRAWVAVNPRTADRAAPGTALGTVTASRWGVGSIEWRAPAGGAQTLVLDTLEDPAGCACPRGCG